MIRNLIIILILLSLTTSCSSQNRVEYSKKLSECFNEKELRLLDDATYIFERKLFKQYGHDNNNNNKNFVAYLDDLSSQPFSLNIKSNFFDNQESNEIIKSLKEVGMYEKIWIEFDQDNSNYERIEIIPLDRYEQENEKENKLKIFVLNPNGSFLRCLDKYYTNKKIKEVLYTYSEHGDIASSLVASIFKNELLEDDFDNNINKVIVTISLYYNMTILLQNNPY